MFKKSYFLKRDSPPQTAHTAVSISTQCNILIIPFAFNFRKRASLQTLSKTLRRSTQHTKSFFLQLQIYLLINVLRMKIWSVVLYPFLKPPWFTLIKLLILKCICLYSFHSHWDLLIDKLELIMIHSIL